MTAVIRSRDNPRVRRWAKLATDARFRRSEGRVLIEGPHLVAEALQAQLEPVALIVSESGLKKAEVRKLVGQREPVVLGDHVFGIVADAETPPGIAAEIAVPKVLEKPDAPAVFLEGVQDPANVSAILRSAAAFGVGEVVVDRACADPWSSKVLRAAMGAHFAVNIVEGADLGGFAGKYKGTVIALIGRGSTSLYDLDLRGPCAFVVGNEGAGISADLAASAKVRASIPTTRRVESLNAGIAGSVALFECMRQRGAGKGTK